MPLIPQNEQIDRTRPECVLLDNRIRQRRATRAQKVDELNHTYDLEEREQIQREIDRTDEEIEALQEELGSQLCYVIPARPSLFLKVVGVEATQSTQFLSIEGTGAGLDNSIRFVANKPLLARVYLRSQFTDAVSVTGRLTVYEFNNHTLKYDILRRNVDPIQLVNMSPSSASRRVNLHETLNFIIPVADCFGKVKFDVRVWVTGHQGDPIYEGEGVLAPVEFISRRIPIIHCFRIHFTRTLPTTPPSQQSLPAPSDADCRTTMDLARRMFPLADLDIRDRGTLDRTGPLETQADYDAVRLAILQERNETTPTPQDHEIYVGMLSDPNPTGSVWGNAEDGCIESVVGFGRAEMFAHELGHLLLPGDDHVSDTACPNNNLMTQIDSNYPDYTNTTQQSGIGEFGVDLGISPPTLFGPDTPDIMSYCGAPQWISPYNYNRATTGDVLNPRSARAAIRTDAQKLLLSFRVYRDGRVEFKKGMHLPGEPRSFPGKAPTGIFLELYGPNDELFASAECCHRSADRLKTAPYEDFQEVLPWTEQAASVLVIREGVEVARWQIEEPAAKPPVTDLTHRERQRERGGTYFHVTWKKRARAEQLLHYTLRFTPDDGQTWLPVARGSQDTQVDVDASCLPGGEKCRFQLAVSTGFRTTLVESAEASVPRHARQVAIIHPTAQAEVACGNPIWLVGAATSLFGEDGKSVDAFWTSNRDGFIGDGVRVLANRLSTGRHVLTLTVEDGIGGEVKESVVIRVQQESVNTSEEKSRARQD
jgi:hypothetical protein